MPDSVLPSGYPLFPALKTVPLLGSGEQKFLYLPVAQQWVEYYILTLLDIYHLLGGIISASSIFPIISPAGRVIGYKL